MARYHLTDAGPMKCSAQIQCPLRKKAIENGEDPNQIFHYANKALAVEAYQNKMDVKHSDSIHETLKKPVKNAASDNGSLANDLVVEDISEEIPERFRDGRLFTGKRISGHIDLDKLDDESYKLFGFERHTVDELLLSMRKDTRNYRKEQHEEPNTKLIYSTYLSTLVSSDAVKDFNKGEREAIHHYAGDGASRINKYLANRNKESASSSQISDANIKRIKQMDAAMAKVPSFQRMVYRGNQWEINHLNPVNPKNFENVAQWVRTERKLGNVVQYDSFTSTSYSRHESHIYAGKAYGENAGNRRAVLYEILTADGIPVESLTQWQGEEEVILPREQRFVIVGHYETSKMVKTNKNDEEMIFNVVQMVAVDKDNNILDGTNHITPEPITSNE